MSDFNADLARFIKKTELKADVVVRKVALQLYSGITKKTPVDTGRARANWNMNIGSIDYSVDDPEQYGESTGKHKGNSAAPASPRAKQLKLDKGDGEKVIYITNNLPYIGELENGHSTQAPRGMVSLTLNEVRSQFR